MINFDPPYLHLLRVLDQCPQQASTYAITWKSRDKNNKFIAIKEELLTKYNMPLKKFKQDIFYLKKEGWILSHEDEEKIYVEFFPTFEPFSWGKTKC